jgi:hypothetical protein
MLLFLGNVYILVRAFLKGNDLVFITRSSSLLSSLLSMEESFTSFEEGIFLFLGEKRKGSNKKKWPLSSSFGRP